MARVGPVVMSVVSDAYLLPVRILAFVWVGSSTAGDTVVVRHRLTHELLWEGRANDTNTYLGVNVGHTGIHAPNGFYLSQISSGQLSVYLREEA